MSSLRFTSKAVRAALEAFEVEHPTEVADKISKGQVEEVLKVTHPQDADSHLDKLTMSDILQAWNRDTGADYLMANQEKQIGLIKQLDPSLLAKKKQ